MADLEFLHFEQLKNEVQAKYLENHTPSHDNISKWKGIDIIYFQEDLRKTVKGNISEKSFYTYFKSQHNSKLPRIDMLNLLSLYAGYTSWFDFKKNHLLAGEILEEEESIATDIAENTASAHPAEDTEEKTVEKPEIREPETQNTSDLQKSASDNQTITEKAPNFSTYDTTGQTSSKKSLKNAVWAAVTAALALTVGLLGFKDELFSKKYYYSFVDSDRNSKINAELQVQILKENESPIVYTAKPNEPFVYTTKSKTLKMVVSSPYYRTDTIYRNLETAPEAESIELKPNDNAIMLYYYSRSIKDLKKKRASLNYLISDNALIYQVFNNEFYGVETMDKQRYITLVTLPSTSLENLEVIDTKLDKSGKIVMIKFRIDTNEIPK